MPKRTPPAKAPKTPPATSEAQPVAAEYVAPVVLPTPAEAEVPSAGASGVEPAAPDVPSAGASGVEPGAVEVPSAPVTGEAVASGPASGGEPLVVAVPEGDATVAGEPGTHARSYRERAKLQRRLRYLRQTRELAFRDLGGFVFDQHRFGRNRDDIVRAKIAGLDSIDRELRALEVALDQHQELLILEEPGISVCPRCGVIHGSDANFCPGCALPRGAGAGVPLGGGGGGTTPAAADPAPPETAAAPGTVPDAYAADQPTTEFKPLPPQ